MLSCLWFVLVAVVTDGQKPADTTFLAPRTIGGGISHWNISYGAEVEVWNHTVAPEHASNGAYLNHFWSAGGRRPVEQYVADRQVIRYYIDGEAVPSIEMEPASGCANGMGYNGLKYYLEGLNLKEPWGNSESTTMFGHSAELGGGWHNRYKIPFSKSIRITVQLPNDVPPDTTVRLFLMFRGIEGDTRPLSAGDIQLPPIVSWRLRLRKFQTNFKSVQPFEFVSLVNYTSISSGARSGGALLWTLFTMDPFGRAYEGCFRAYTAATGAESKFPGLLLSTGTEDYYDSAYEFSDGKRVITEDAGLSHYSFGGSKHLASMYRFHHHDPVYFRNRFELVWRDGDEMIRMPDGSYSRKCLANTRHPVPGARIGGSVANVTFDAWLYTWEEPESDMASLHI